MTWVLLNTELNTFFLKKTAAEEDEGLPPPQRLSLPAFTAHVSLILVQKEHLTSTPTVSLTFGLSILQHATQKNSVNQNFKQLKQSTISDKIN